MTSRPWGHIRADGKFRAIPKQPMIMAGLTQPPFDVTRPDGMVLHIIEAPPDVVVLEDPDAMFAENDSFRLTLVAALIDIEEAAKQFRKYEAHHRAKPDLEKAETNQDRAIVLEGMAGRIRAAIGDAGHV